MASSRSKSKGKSRARQPIVVPDEQDVRPRWFGPVTWIAVGLVAAYMGFWLAKRQAEGGAKQVAPPARGLPHTPDYHALLVSPDDPRRIVLGTHAGLYESSDGGRTWQKGPLARKDAMNLVRTRGGRIWAAGHYVLFDSDDGGRTWESVHPSGLPSLDLHGFTTAPDGTLYAAVHGEGLYRSRDGGRTYSLVSEKVGPDVFGLSVTPTGRILAADSRRGVLASDNRGRTWKLVLRAPVVGMALNPGRPTNVLAAGAAIFLSHDVGAHWRKVFTPPEGAGPVTWAPSAPRIAYAVGFDRILYRSADGGRTWRPVR